MGQIENTSTGTAGYEPEARKFGRLYQTYPESVNSLDGLINGFTKLREGVNGHRRIVFRSLCPNEVLDRSIEQTNLPIEAVIPMSEVTGHDESIIFLGENYHPSPRQCLDNLLNSVIEIKPLNKIETVIKNGFTLSNQLNENDLKNLFELWNRFGWSQAGILDFIGKIQSGAEGLWFSGIRNKDKQLVSASQAELMNFAGLQYIETTEYSTLDGHEKLGLCTASVQGLIAHVLMSTHYSNGLNSLLPVITAEFNTCSTSSAVGANAGLIIPRYSVSIPQILSYNVAVLDGKPPNNVPFDKWSQAPDEIPYHYLRDFAVAVLPANNIQELYPPQAVEKIINLYQ